MAYIDAEKLKRNIRVNIMPNVDIDGTVTVENAERYFINLIDKTSATDVEKVVRCKDCKYWHLFKANPGLGDCENAANGLFEFTKPDDFCSYGKRRDT